ncbi:MAG: tetratricopeptide repeat protein, partial [Candidatus Heimdallarchaeota archaeon]|nr:tetratricopeptide repeat protein [Candidatus Heimdallarchaeota archaeon]
MKLLRLVGMGSQVLNDWVREIISNMYETTLDRVLEKIDNFLNLNLNSESSLSLLFLKIKCLEVKGDHGEILNIIEDLHQFPDHTYLKNIFQIIKLQIELYTKDKNEILNNVKILDSLNLNGVDKEYLIELHGDIFALRGDYNKAIEQFIQIDNSEFYLDYDREYRLKNKIAQSYRELKEYSQGFKYVNSMIEDQEINRYSPQLAIALNIKGIILSDLGKFDESIDYLNKSLSIKNRYKNPFEISKTYNNLATNYFYKGDYINAENFFLKSLAMRRATGDKRKIAHLCSNLAVFYNYINNYSKAIDYYNESITYFEELGNDIELSQAINNLGFLQFQNQEYLQAIENFNASLKLRKKIDNEEHIAETLYFLALTKYRLGYFKKAEKISVELLKYRETVGNKHHLADTLELLGGLSMHKGDLYESMQYFDRCKQYRLEIGNNHFTSNCYMEIAKLHRIKGEYNLALGMLTNALEFIDKLPLDKLRIDISYQIGLVHLENLDVTAAQNTIELMEQLISNQADTPSNKVPLELLKNKLNKLISGSIDNIHVRDLYDIIFSGKIKNIDLVSDIVLNLC